MAKTFRLPKDEPLLNIASYARSGPNATTRLTPSQIEHIRLTVNRAPEAVVKVLPRHCNDLKAVGKHIDYIGRRGNLDLEGDDGERLRGRVGAVLLEDWDLDIDDARRQGGLTAATKRSPPKLVHKLMFSMPPGTPPQKVLTAVRNFAREEFYGQHRYAMVLHTDEPHPHVHLVLKAMSEQGARLNIKKATLRHWRSQFAGQLRALGVEANATERSVRSEKPKQLKDGIYRASLRDDSWHMHARADRIARDLAQGRSQKRSAALVETRAQIERGWTAVFDLLISNRVHDLAAQVGQYLRDLPPPRTDQELAAEKLRLERSTSRLTRGQVR